MRVLAALANRSANRACALAFQFLAVGGGFTGLHLLTGIICAATAATFPSSVVGSAGAAAVSTNQ